MRKTQGGPAMPVTIANGESGLLVIRDQTGVPAISVSIGPTDPLNDIPVITDSSHHHVHEGETFIASYLIDSLASGSSFDFRLAVPVITPVLRAPHLELEVISTFETELQLSEAATFSANGTSVVAYNRNRNILTAAQMMITHTPTVTGVGTVIWLGLTGSGKSSGGERGLSEWVLKSDTLYLFRVTSRAAADKIVVRFNWYEDLGV